MSLVYRFKKERLEEGVYLSRPTIDIILRGKNTSVEIPALIDSGCDRTVIPEGVAKAIGLNMDGKKTKFYAYKESTDAIISKARITFQGKVERQSVTLDIPILIAKGDKEENITLGIDGIFDAFHITFKKSQNKIILKRATMTPFY